LSWCESETGFGGKVMEKGSAQESEKVVDLADSRVSAVLASSNALVVPTSRTIPGEFRMLGTKRKAG
jgi:hypothetical protein